MKLSQVKNIGVTFIVLAALTLASLPARAETAAIGAILDLGRHQTLPLGIVCDDKESLLKLVTLPSGDDPQALTKIVEQLDGYRIVELDGLTVVMPEHLSANARTLLHTKIPVFHADATTVTSLSIKLWMAFEYEVTKPPPGAFAGVLHHADEKLVHPIDLQATNVEGILSAIVLAIHGGGAWVVLPAPEPLSGQPQERLWGLIRYDSAPTPLPVDKLCCIERGFLRAEY